MFLKENRTSTPLLIYPSSYKLKSTSCLNKTSPNARRIYKLGECNRSCKQIINGLLITCWSWASTLLIEHKWSYMHCSVRACIILQIYLPRRHLVYLTRCASRGHQGRTCAKILETTLTQQTAKMESNHKTKRAHKKWPVKRTSAATLRSSPARLRFTCNACM